MRWLVAAAVAVTACAGRAAVAPDHPAPRAPGPLAGFATADLVAFRDGNVVAYAIAGDKLVELGTLALAKRGDDAPVRGISGDWADRDHLIVQIGSRDVVMITASALVHLPVPEPAKLTAPRPATANEGIEEGNDDALVVGDGAAAWSRCAWGDPYDGFQCEVPVIAQLWPTTKITRGEWFAPRRWSFPSAVPAGFTETHDDHALVCQAPGGSGAVLRSDPKDDSEQIGDASWISAAPPQLLVIYGHFGLDALVADRWTLHDTCAAQPIAQGRDVEPGPGELWISRGAGDGDKRVLRRGARVIGELPDGAIAFRPR